MTIILYRLAFKLTVNLSTLPLKIHQFYDVTKFKVIYQAKVDILEIYVDVALALENCQKYFFFFFYFDSLATNQLYKLFISTPKSRS